MIDERSAGPVLVRVAQRHVDHRLKRRDAPGHEISRRGEARLSLDEELCRRMADHHHAAPALQDDAGLRAQYRELKRRTAELYRSITTEAGITVRPWTSPGQPYRDSRDLRRRVRSSGVLWVYPTRAGHGPSCATDRRHPMREPSGVQVDGVELCHNDLFRAVHDVFGHLMFGHGFGPAGEFRAAFCQMALYPPDVHPVLFTEQVGQVAWFFYGPHLRLRDGRLPRRGEPGYVPPHHRPYPQQKVFRFAEEFVEAFPRMFDLGATGEES
ncbi:crotonobetainyl-CoA--carnitine CoA-transferase [Actinomadura miaoliensis]|uniref:Crotonobetainyl-CoA--carnitine CoA-transferase n=1 Tax=Actinomadura miaoliensis TaxID=430685 RepID=A0ABP7VQ10_9ACTN